jgi:hypothetical protein
MFYRVKHYFSVAADKTTTQLNYIQMPLSFQVTGAEKNQLVVSLAAILLSDSGIEVSAGLILTLFVVLPVYMYI